MNDLDKAIETITEGGEALGVSCEDVYRAMIKDEGLILPIMSDIHAESTLLHPAFSAMFDYYARKLLKEAQRANLELEAGL